MKVSVGTKGNWPTLAPEAAKCHGKPAVGLGHSQGYLWQSLLFNREWAGVAEVALLATFYLAEQTYSPCNVFLLLVTDPFYSSFPLGGGGAGCTPEPAHTQKAPLLMRLSKITLSVEISLLLRILGF